MRLLIISFVLTMVFRLDAAIHVKYADRITAKHQKKMVKAYGLKAFGSGGGMIDDVKIISLDLSSSEVADLERARFLYVTAVNDLLSMINSSEMIRPYLHNYPFTIDNLRYSISFSIFKDNYPVNKIADVMNVDDKLIYSIIDKDGESQTVHKEMYEEAVRKVKERG